DEFICEMNEDYNQDKFNISELNKQVPHDEKLEPDEAMMKLYCHKCMDVSTPKTLSR
ncbi:hypothetical protein JEQ12_006947, partial [Ovis aries]